MKCDTVTEKEKLVKRIQSRLGGEYEYSLCILDESVLEEELIERIKKLDGTLIIFGIAGDADFIHQMSKNSNLCQFLYKPIFQSVLFDAVMNIFGEYQVEEKDDIDYDFQGIHAMIVEDNLVNADILTRVLRRVRIETTICENGKVAVDLFEKEPEDTFQIIFMDIQMPVMDGYEATRRIRASVQEQGKTIPIIAVSANAFREDMEKSMQSGMNAHLSKPINAQRLYKEISNYID